MALQKDVVSLSLRRAWIEICCINIIDDSFRSLSLRRAWIEIARTWEPTRRPDGRSPYGERGLKSRLALHRPTARLSLSLRRAWIEITIRPFVIGWPCRSPYGERGLKYLDDADSPAAPTSLSLRRAWIEIVPVFLPVKIRSKSRSPYGERGLK